MKFGAIPILVNPTSWSASRMMYRLRLSVQYMSAAKPKRCEEFLEAE